MAINFPNSPTIGDEFTGGGFTWTWTGSAWEKLVQSTGSDFTEISARAAIQLTALEQKIVTLSSIGGQGLYRFTFYANDGSVPTVTISEKNGTFDDITTANLITPLSQSGLTQWSSYRFLNTNANTSVITLNSTESGLMFIDNISLYQSPPVTVTAYTTSQQLTFSTTVKCALLGGGGGGASGGGGGGSGYLVKFDLSPGTYTLVAGAGGSGGSAGGTSTIDQYSANGGSPGAVLGGGAGGSGGGGAATYPASGAGGGANGANGGNSSFAGGGAGSGVTLGYLQSIGGGGGSGGGGGGGGGGVYGGGGGAGGVNNSGFISGGAAYGIGGGGGGATNSGGGGAGFNGGLIVVEGI